MIAEKDSARRQRPAWHEGFLDLLPAIKNYIRYAFRRLSRQDRYEAIHEAVANALVAYARLVQLGKQSLAFATPLARYAVKQVCEGRRVGNRRNVRDVMSGYCQQRKGVKLEPFAKYDCRTDQWKELLVEDRRSSPADIAATKLDFHAWLNSLSPKKRAITETLAGGETTGKVAKMFGVTASRIGQLRQELRTAWHQFQGELEQPAVLAMA